MKLILIRHGRPDEADATRPHDPPLSADGWRQARAAAALLATEGVTGIVASPLLRAQQTARPLAERQGLDIETVADPEAFRAAVIGALTATAARAPRNARIAVFTHGLPINVVLAHALGLDSITHFLVGYGSVTRVRARDDGGYGVSSINETGHHRFEITGTATS